MTDDNSFKDFDAAVREVEERTLQFQIGGETFDANPNINAGRMLKWMSAGSSLQAVPSLLQALMAEDDYERLVETLIEKDIPFSTLADILVWLVEQVGDSGN